MKDTVAALLVGVLIGASATLLLDPVLDDILGSSGADPVALQTSPSTSDAIVTPGAQDVDAVALPSPPDPTPLPPSPSNDAAAPPPTATQPPELPTPSQAVPSDSSAAPPLDQGAPTQEATDEVVLAPAAPPAIEATSTRGAEAWISIATRLAPAVRPPSDCPLPLNEPASMPNSDRSYRGGVHQGIDFICQETGRSAFAAMDGRVAMAMGTWVEPTPADRSALLSIATALGRTPFWTLAFLYGRFVVLDHGLVQDVGHVYSIYAHMAALDPAIRQGITVPAGTRLGEIGNAGTSAAGTGEDNPRSLHLHWEMFIGDEFLGQGLSEADTAAVYARLFGVG